MLKIGEGKTATVYLDGNFAYKCYHNGYDIKNINYEVMVQNEVYSKTKLNVAKYEIEDKKIKMTFFDGALFADRIRIEKYKNWLDDFIDLQVSVYQYKDLDLLDSYSIFKNQISNSDLNDNLKNKALKSLHNIEKIKSLCHFDFHPLNIIYSQKKYYIIDWTNAKLGNPVMDIASTYIIFRQYLKRQSNKYLRMISKKINVLESDVIKAIPVMAFIKLRENHELQHEQLLIDLVMGNDGIFQKENV
ncbi:MAG: phosphotransferase [Candidatus Izemoplasmatales bacterium]